MELAVKDEKRIKQEEITKAIEKYIGIENLEMTEAEKVVIFEICKKKNLNPLLKEVFLIPFADKNGSKKVQMVVPATTWSSWVMKQPNYGGFIMGDSIPKMNPYTKKPDVVLECKIKNKSGAILGNFMSWLSEIKKPTYAWGSMIAQMHQKTAFIGACRRVFGDVFNNVYTLEEFGRTIDVEGNLLPVDSTIEKSEAEVLKELKIELSAFVKLDKELVKELTKKYRSLDKRINTNQAESLMEFRDYLKNSFDIEKETQKKQTEYGKFSLKEGEITIEEEIEAQEEVVDEQQ